MAREVTILIPDEYDQDDLIFKVFSGERPLLEYQLTLIDFSMDDTSPTRADFIKKKIDEYSEEYMLMHVGDDGNNKIPLLFRIMGDREEIKK